jgi:hypothetical protein
MIQQSRSVEARLQQLLGKQTAIFDELRGLMPEEFANDLETGEPIGMAWHSAMEAVGDARDGVEDLARMISEEAPGVEPPVAQIKGHRNTGKEIENGTLNYRSAAKVASCRRVS